MMPQLSEPAVEVTGGSTATTMRMSSGRAGEAALLEVAALPQAGHALFDDLAFQLLLADERVAVAALHLGQERRRQEAGVVGGARAGGGGGVVFQHLLQQRDGARRGGDHALRPLAEPQRKLQRVPGVVGLAPLAELVAPGGIELRSAQAVGIVGGEHLGDGAVGPDELVLGDLELGALVGRIDREQARHALDHDAAHLGDGVADERDAVRAAVGERRLAQRPGRGPIRRRCGSCRSRGRRARATCASGRRPWRARARAGRRGR